MRQCPFCGGDPILYEDDTLAAPFWVECMSCSSRTWYYHTARAAENVWEGRICSCRARQVTKMHEKVASCDEDATLF